MLEVDDQVVVVTGDLPVGCQLLAEMGQRALVQSFDTGDVRVGVVADGVPVVALLVTPVDVPVLAPLLYVGVDVVLGLV